MKSSFISQFPFSFLRTSPAPEEYIVDKSVSLLFSQKQTFVFVFPLYLENKKEAKTLIIVKMFNQLHT